MDEFAALPDAELLKLWDRETDFARRDLLVKALIARNLFPADYVRGWETSTGAYPSQEDPEFLQKLLSKREFAESLQRTWMPTGDPCSGEGDFEGPACGYPNFAQAARPGCWASRRAFSVLRAERLWRIRMLSASTASEKAIAK